MNRLQEAPHRSGVQARGQVENLLNRVRIGVAWIAAAAAMYLVLQFYLPPPAAPGMHGPLAQFRLAADGTDHHPCHSDACMVSVAQGAPAALVRRHGARYLAPAPRTLHAPPGTTIRGSHSVQFTWMPHENLPRRMAPDNHIEHVLSTLVPDGARPDPHDLFADDDAYLTVVAPGYVRSATEAGSGRAVTLHGSAPDVQGTLPDPALSALVYQPFDYSMTFEIADAAGLPLRLAQAVMINFDGLRAAQPGKLAPLDETDRFRAHVIDVERDGKLARVRLFVRPRSLPNLLISRVQLEQTTGRPAFPEHVQLEFPVPHDQGAAFGLKVPASAVVRDNKGTLVWIVFDDEAVPLQVLSDGAAPHSVVTVSAAGGARGLPIRPEHWRALSADLRSRLFLAKGALLTRTNTIIEKPGAALQPGQKVRTRHAAS